jgi:hypothetical protein
MIANRVRETSTTTGTGTLTLAGAVTGYKTFVSGIGSGNKCFYVIELSSDWEVGIGTVGATTLSRDTVIASSNSNNLVAFGTGIKSVYNSLPAEIINPSLKTNTDGATVTFDMGVNDTHQVTLGGNRTLAVSNVRVGQKFTVRLAQDATGGRTVTWWSNIKWTAPTLSTGANKVDWFGFVCTSTGNFDGFVIAQNM